MKKSEKVKGKERVAAKKKQMLLIAAGAVIVFLLAIAIFSVFFNPSVVKSGDTVSVYYTGKLDNGTVFDSNVNGTPLVFDVGKGFVIPGFDEAVIGMAPGTTKTVRFGSEKGYGSYKNELVHVVNRSTLPSNVTPRIGERYTVRRTSDGGVAYVTVINLTPTTVTWDENHELAGKDLTFTITLAEIVKK